LISVLHADYLTTPVFFLFLQEEADVGRTAGAAQPIMSMGPRCFDARTLFAP
jgi:hypothetical protein